MSSSRPVDAQNAQTQWEAENKVETIDAQDEIYKFDNAEQQNILSARPWTKE
jgi:hypothetical protein